VLAPSVQQPPHDDPFGLAGLNRLFGLGTGLGAAPTATTPPSPAATLSSLLGGGGGGVGGLFPPTGGGGGLEQALRFCLYRLLFFLLIIFHVSIGH
jgi:hypothetical protein